MTFDDVAGEVLLAGIPRRGDMARLARVLAAAGHAAVTTDDAGQCSERADQDARPRLPRLRQRERPVESSSARTRSTAARAVWPLAGEEVTEAGAALRRSRRRPVRPEAATARTCANGHPLEPGDQMCLECGADPAPVPWKRPVARAGRRRTDGTRPGAERRRPPVADRSWTLGGPGPRPGRRQGPPWERFEVVRGRRAARRG